MDLRIRNSLAISGAARKSRARARGEEAPNLENAGAEPTPPRLQRGEILDWCTAGRVATGERVSGDLPVVLTWASRALVGLIDGLGHGEAAAVAARRALSALDSCGHLPLVEAVQRCHAAIRDTRGVVMTLVSIDAAAGTATALGVGNVEAFIYRCDASGEPQRETILLRGGIVGYQLPGLHATEVPLAPNDLLVLATDGVRSDFFDLINADESLPALVQRILDHKAGGTDDALVLACRYKGHS